MLKRQVIGPGPSALEEFLATLPEPLSILAHEAIAEEWARLERGEYTKEELEALEQIKALAKSARETHEKMIIEVLNAKKTS